MKIKFRYLIIIAVIFSFVFIWSTELNITNFETAILYLLAVIYYIVFLKFVFLNNTLVKIKKLNMMKMVIFLSITAIISGLILFALPINHNKVVLSNRDAKIIITATGEKSISSQGAEVWITKVRANDKEQDFSKISLNTGWEIKDAKLASFEQQPASIEIDTKGSNNLSIRFISHAWSGIAKITIGDVSEKIDLYSLESTEKEFDVGKLILEKDFLTGYQEITFYLLCLILIWIVVISLTIKIII